MGRGRPRRFSDDVLVAAALRVMEREGYRALTIRSLAGELGTSHTTLYNYLGAIEEIEDRAVRKLADQMPAPRSTSAPELRSELMAFLRAARRLLLLHPGVLLSKPGSAVAQAFLENGARWQLALLPYAPDPKSLQLALGALVSIVLVSVEAERRLGPDFDKPSPRDLAKLPADSLARQSTEQYFEAMIDFVLPGLSTGATGRKPVSRRSVKR